MDSKKSSELLLRMQPSDCLTIPAIAEMLGTDEGEIRQLIRVHGLTAIPLSRTCPQAPTRKGVQSLNSDSPYYVPRNSVRDLVRLVATKEALAIFKNLCNFVESDKLDG